MDITTRTSLVGFLLALSALSLPDTAAIAAAPTAHPSIEARLTRLSTALRERANQLPEPSLVDQNIALGWADGSGRDWVNGRGGGGWADGYRGDWVNRNNWRNGWADGGGFYNRY